MSYIIGVDGCRAGWIAILKDLDSGVITSEVFTSSDQLFSQPTKPDILALDIPIGLTDAGPRQCDLLARKMLGQPRGSSVFRAPIRSAVNASNRQEADAISRSVDGKGVGAQAFGIYPRICEVDRLIRTNNNLREIVFEVHPELCFMAWNNGEPIQESKKSHEGMSIRLGLVQSHFGIEAAKAMRERFPSSQVADDDIYDAFAALWTAERIKAGTADVIPDKPEIDSFGLHMRMWL